MSLRSEGGKGTWVSPFHPLFNLTSENKSLCLLFPFKNSSAIIDVLCQAVPSILSTATYVFSCNSLEESACYYSHFTNEKKETRRWIILRGFPVDSCLQWGRRDFDLWVGMIPLRRKWQPTPVFLPGMFHGQRSLGSYSLWSPKESDTTERLTHMHTHIHSAAQRQKNMQCKGVWF